MLKPISNTYAKIAFFALLTAGIFMSVQAQTPQNLIRQGNQKYSNADYGLAEVDYRKSLEKNNAKTTHTASFNLGDALFKQGRYEEAATQFEQIGKTGTDNNLKSNAFYNMGNSLLKAKKIPESIEAYKNALRLNPNNADAKYNLAYARKLKEQEQEQEQQQQDQQQQNQDQNQQNQDQQQQQDKEQQQQQDQQQQDKQNQDQQQQQQDKEQQDQQQQQQSQGQEGKEGDKQDQQQAAQSQGQERKLSKEETARLLEALKNEELKVQQKLKQRQGKANKTRVDKDW